MKSLLKYLTETIKDLTIVRNLPRYFNEDERRIVVQSIVIGVVVWAVVYTLKELVHRLFHLTLHWLENGSSLLLVFVPLLIGALIVTIIAGHRAATIHYRDADGRIHELNDVEGDGLERAISLYYASEPTLEQALTGQEGVDVRWQMPTFSLAGRKFLATLVTLGSGGSGGLEASVTLIGESLAAGLFKPRRLGAEAAQHLTLLQRIWRWWQPENPDHLQTAQLSGIAAAVAVLFGAPFAAAFFAAEVMYRRRPLIEKLVYSLIAALVAFFLTQVVSQGHTRLFEVETLYIPDTDWRYVSVLLLMSAVIALMSIFFSRWRARTEYGFHHRLPNMWLRHLVGAATTGVIAIAVVGVTTYFDMTEHGLELVLGSGESVISMALAGQLTAVVALIALLAKMPATLATVGSGGSAGLLVPSLFFGTMVASIFAEWFGYEPMLLIIPGMTASLVSIVNVPLAAILFTVEVFGSAYMIPALIVLVISALLAHDNSIYRTQRETFDSRQILPGIGVRRVGIPAEWTGQTLVDLDFRQRFDLNVIGLVEREGKDGLPHVRLGTAATTPLHEGDLLVVLGREENLDALETAVARH